MPLLHFTLNGETFRVFSSNVVPQVDTTVRFSLDPEEYRVVNVSYYYGNVDTYQSDSPDRGSEVVFIDLV